MSALLDIKNSNSIPTDWSDLILSYLTRSERLTFQDQSSLFTQSGVCTQWRSIALAPTSYFIYSKASAKELLNVVFKTIGSRAAAVTALGARMEFPATEGVAESVVKAITTSQTSAKWLADVIQATNLQSLDISIWAASFHELRMTWHEQSLEWVENNLEWSKVTSIFSSARMLANVKNILVVIHSEYLAVKHTDLIERVIFYLYSRKMLTLFLWCRLLQTCGNLESLVIDGIIREKLNAPHNQFQLPSVASSTIDTIKIRTQMDTSLHYPIITRINSVNQITIPALLQFTSPTLKNLALYGIRPEAIAHLPLGLVSLHLEYAHKSVALQALQARIPQLVSLTSLYLGEHICAVFRDLTYLAGK